MNTVKKLVAAVMFFPLIGLAQTKKTTLPVGKGTSVQQAISRGKLVYSVNCLSCHQADGYGVASLNPPLVGTSWVLGNKSTLIGLLFKGSQGQVEIDGETFHNTMPAQAHLSDQQIADVLTYVRNAFGNKASIVTPAEVKAVRAKTK